MAIIEQSQEQVPTVQEEEDGDPTHLIIMDYSSLAGTVTDPQALNSPSHENNPDRDDNDESDKEPVSDNEACKLNVEMRPVTAPTPPKPDQQFRYDYQKALWLLVSIPFQIGSPFKHVPEFVQHLREKCGHALEAQDFMSNLLVGTSTTVRPVLSKMGVCYHPSVAAEKQNHEVRTRLKLLVEKIKNDPNVTIVLKADDFNWLHIKGAPGSANSSKLSEARKTANLATSVYDVLKDGIPRFPLGCIPNLSDPDTISQFVDATFQMAGAAEATEVDFASDPFRKSYMDIREDVPSHRFYNFDVSAPAAPQENLAVISSLDNPLKSVGDMLNVMQKFIHFVGSYLRKNTAAIVGNFYIFKYVVILLYMKIQNSSTSTGTTIQQLTLSQHELRRSLLPFPDVMHVALNAQEAIIRFGWDLLQPIWLSGFPDANFQPFKIRPIRRIAMLATLLGAWKRIRPAIIAEYDQISKQINISASRKVFLDALIWIFEEAIPLSHDIPRLLHTENPVKFTNALKRILPLFIRLRKRNYVIITAYMFSGVQ
ncbi:hypothetical protein HK102_014206, partial [Quaeritorhiza haematococci]